MPSHKSLQSISPLVLFTLFFLYFSSITEALPLKTEVQNAQGEAIAKAWIYIDYVEILTLEEKLLGKVGVVNAQGEHQLFLVKGDQQATYAGHARNKRVYNVEGKLIGYYNWTSFWIYVYDTRGRKLGQTKCIGFRGFCAAASAAYLTGLFRMETGSIRL